MITFKVKIRNVWITYRVKREDVDSVWNALNNIPFQEVKNTSYERDVHYKSQGFTKWQYLAEMIQQIPTKEDHTGIRQAMRLAQALPRHMQEFDTLGEYLQERQYSDISEFVKDVSNTSHWE